MAAPKRMGRGGAGWALVAAVLAVPGFLFYNWWSRLKAEHDRYSRAGARAASGAVFQTPPSGSPAKPMAAQSSPPAARPARPAAPAATAAPQTGGEPPAAAMPASAAPVELGQDAAGGQVAPLRDPMESPMDVARRREAELGEEAARREKIASARQTERRRAPRQSSIEKQIQLQGIVAASDGKNLALINGETISEGESFRVARYPGKVKTLSVSSTAVTLEYQGRRFVLKVKVR